MNLVSHQAHAHNEVKLAQNGAARPTMGSSVRYPIIQMHYYLKSVPGRVYKEMIDAWTVVLLKVHYGT